MSILSIEIIIFCSFIHEYFAWLNYLFRQPLYYLLQIVNLIFVQLFLEHLWIINLMVYGSITVYISFECSLYFDTRYTLIHEIHLILVPFRPIFVLPTCITIVDRFYE
uniref:Uncharacterized protein n=1 Tax=Cacopsylla melanoneura TaxID=428564 RepID=A0A8D8RB55_9HEMI